MNKDIAIYTEVSLQEFEEENFTWEEKVKETKELVKENDTLTSTIDNAKVKRLHVQIRIGLNLIQLQKKYGRSDTGTFTTEEIPKLGIDQRFAYRCIEIAKFAQEYGRSLTRVSKTDLLSIPLSMRIWNELARPSTPRAIVEKVATGEIQATSKAIHKEIEEYKRREKDLNQKNEELHDKVHFLLEAEEKDNARIKELQTEIVLKNKWIDNLSEELEDNRGGQVQSPMSSPIDTTDLENTIKGLHIEKARLEEELEASKRIAHKNLLLDRTEQEIYDEEIRGNNKHRNGRLEKALREAILLFPSVLDAQQAYGSDEWTRDEQMRQQLIRYIGMIEEIKKMSHVVDA